MLPLVGGLLLAGPISGFLSDRFGARPFATLGAAARGASSFVLLELLPVDFPYAVFAALLALNGIGDGPVHLAQPRGGDEQPAAVAARRRRRHDSTPFQNSAQVLSIGIFFSLMIIGLSSHLPATLYHGLVAHGVPAQPPRRISHLPPVATLFATFLGYNPIAHLLGHPVLAPLPPAQAAILTGTASSRS